MDALRKINVKVYLVALLCLGCVVVGFMFGRIKATDSTDSVSFADESAVKYVCPMNISYHPYFSSADPKEKCGYCGMDLVPDAGGDTGEGDRVLVMSKAAMKLAEVEVMPVERRFVDIKIPMAGKIDFDETRIKTISAWVDGRLDRLFVDYTGIPVKKGDHLVEIYSPALYSAQEELLQALKTVDDLSQDSAKHILKTASRTVEAVREKLRLLGLSDTQIAQLEETRKASARIEIKAPIGGIVIHKNAKEGMYVKTGTPIYTVADMSRLWVKLDAYESDLPWLKYGQKVDVRTQVFGDKVFEGLISFIDPVLDDATRTAKVRVLVDNPDGLLRPNMFVRAVVSSRAGEGGVVLVDGLDDKWICPMHPEVSEDSKMACEICGMDLVSAVDLGYTNTEAVNAPLVVPGSAVMITGKRSIVYVRREDAETPTFEGVDVELGSRAGDDYIVTAGLEEGQLVVVNGNFKIDSALQLRAKPSMMNPDAGVPVPSHNEAGEAEHSGAMAEKVTAVSPQKLCPIMGGAINRDVFTDHKGYRIYFCCPGCDGPFMDDPDGHIAKMLAQGITLEKSPESLKNGHEGHGK